MVTEGEPPGANRVQSVVSGVTRCYPRLMRRFRTLVIGLLILWLPLQAIAAVSMPFCPHGGLAQTSVRAHRHHADSTPGSGHHGVLHGDHQHPTGGLQQCNNCGACNLACAPAVPVSVVLLCVPATTVQPHFTADSSGLFIPDQPQPPPNSRS
jgi:hypothetical protein